MKIVYKNIKGYSQLIPLTFILSAFIFISSCKKFVNIPPPTTELVTANVFNNNASASSALTNIYTLMYANLESFNMAYQTGLYSDELQNYSSVTSSIQYFTNSLLASTGSGQWTNAYKYIYDANAVITGLQNTVGCSPSVKQQLTGEAYFIRAFWHFYLTDAYGDVPLVVTPDYNINGTIARSSRIQVLQQVVADLQNAQNLLNSNYVDGSDTITTTLRVRPNKAVASALLARAYLYLGDYSKDATQYASADAQATSVISNSTYNLSSLNGVFLANSSEAIWQLQTPPTSIWDTYDGNAFILIGAPATSGANSTTISQQLMNSFETNDQRKTNWIGNYTTYYFPYKYKNRTLLNQEYTMVLRLGEQYLIRAEAEAHENKLSSAITDLNVIRTRAGLPATTATTQVALLTAILHERQVELFAEWGHRWFDLERTGNASSVLGPPGNVCQAKGGIWSSDNHQLLFPIPQADRNSDPNLTQNAGY